LNLLPFGKVSGMINLRSVKKIGIIVSFVPTACPDHRMTSVGGHTNILRVDGHAVTRTRHLSRFLQNGSLPVRGEFVVSLLMLQHEQLLGGGQQMRHPAPREFFNPSSL
jgi:prepilin-type processing-associated H-X9-DG protein